MRILVVQDTDWIRRGPHQQHHVFERLAARGHEVRVIDFPLLWRTEGRKRVRRAAETVAAPSKIGLDVEILLKRPPFVQLPWLDILSYSRAVGRLMDNEVRTWRPDVLVGHGILSDRAATRVSRRHGIPYVAHWLDALDQLVEPRLGRPLARRIMRRNLRQAERIVVINRRLGKYAARLGASPDRIVTIPAGIDLDRYARDDGREAERRKLGITPDQIVLGFVGWLYSFSGIDRVAEAVLAQPAGANVALLVVGEGDLLPRLGRLASREGAQGRLFILGQQPYDRIPALLSATDACLLPAARNPTMEWIVPIKVYEYLAAGRPVYATDLPGLREEFGTSPGLRFVRRPGEMLEHVMADRLQPADTVRHAASLRSILSNQGWDSVVDEFEGVLETSASRRAH